MQAKIQIKQNSDRKVRLNLKSLNDTNNVRKITNNNYRILIQNKILMKVNMTEKIFYQMVITNQKYSDLKTMKNQAKVIWNLAIQKFLRSREKEKSFKIQMPQQISIN